MGVRNPHWSLAAEDSKKLENLESNSVPQDRELNRDFSYHKKKAPEDGRHIGINLREFHTYLVYLSILEKVVCIAFFFSFAAFRRISNKVDYITYYFNNRS